VAGVEAELLVAGNTVTINVFDEDRKPISSKGFTGAALVVQGADRETVTLGPVDENSLKGNSKNPIKPGATVTVTLKAATGKSGQVRFKP
jgi:nitrogen fixation protein FixH